MIGPLGMQEMLIIMVVALIVFGPRKLPQIGKTLGKSLAEFRRTSTELRNTLEREVEMEEFRSAREEVSGLGRDLRGGLDPTGGAPPPGRRSAEDGGPPGPVTGDAAGPEEARDPPPDEESPPDEGSAPAAGVEDAGSSGNDAAPAVAPDAAGSAAGEAAEDPRPPKEASDPATGEPPDRGSEPNAPGG